MSVSTPAKRGRPAKGKQTDQLQYDSSNDMDESKAVSSHDAMFDRLFSMLSDLTDKINRQDERITQLSNQFNPNSNGSNQTNGTGVSNDTRVLDRGIDSRTDTNVRAYGLTPN